MLNPEGRARAVPGVGWHGNVYVLPDGAIGEENGEHHFIQTEHLLDHKYNVRGTLDEWKANVAEPCMGNSRLVFAVSLSLAASLITPCGIESGGFHYLGSSSIGKTTAAYVAGSVYGGGDRRGFVVSWRATVNGLEGVAVLHNDALIPLDELGQLPAKDAAEIAYMLANGSGKNRAGRSGGLRKAARWATLFLSTGEVSLADKIAECPHGKRLTAGQEVRFIEIPADGGSYGLFEDIHGFPRSQAFADHMSKVAREYFGTAVREFIKRIIEGGLDDIAAALRRAANEFVAKVCRSGKGAPTNVPKGEFFVTDADGQVLRAGHRFGFVAAVGELAIALGILPWEKGEAWRAASKCFEAWIDSRGGAQAAEAHDSVRAIRDFVQTHGSSRFMAAWEEDKSKFPDKVVNLAGYREMIGDKWHYYLTPGGWWQACAGLNPKTVAKTLIEYGHLQTGGDKYSKSIHVPGIGQTRVYHVQPTMLENDA